MTLFSTGCGICVLVTAIGLGIGIFNTEVSPLGPSFNIFWVFVAYIIIYTLLVSLCYNILFYYILPRFVYKDSSELEIWLLSRVAISSVIVAWQGESSSSNVLVACCVAWKRLYW